MTAKTTPDLFDELNVCVLVPTYNNARTLPSVLSAVLWHTPNVIVINDGSTDATPAVLHDFSAVTVISYPVNKGKGYALRVGFSKAAELGYDYAITIDADGQHDPADLPLFLEKLRQHPGSVIIGARNMEQDGVPGRSSFGNKFSTFWFKVETGHALSDTQSGYRLYPLRKLDAFSFFTRKYEFEIEVLVRAAWAGVDIVEVPVRVYYPEKDKRVSHFRPVRDFTRISILNSILVTIALLYIKPRNLLRSIKKKTSGNFFTTFYLIQTNRTPEKRWL